MSITLKTINEKAARLADQNEDQLDDNWDWDSWYDFERCKMLTEKVQYLESLLSRAYSELEQEYFSEFSKTDLGDEIKEAIKQAV